jgi:hypothetical protein
MEWMKMKCSMKCSSLLRSFQFDAVLLASGKKLGLGFWCAVVFYTLYLKQTPAND